MDFSNIQRGTLPDHLGLVWDSAEKGHVTGHMQVQPHHLAPNGYLHAASVIALADTACGYGCIASLPDGAKSFATIELKSNFLGTARDGVVQTVATIAHAGRTTQLWDAEVTHRDTGKRIALFRCTQMILY
ncbi:PaaI family thioesterase [Paracoccus tegillarcae]|uniref:Competence protein ComA n=1 Tax=Paracoccus tegillarcae TaxID=1529068 RepID=A0A2K9EHR9_9RHOB|nr:PaaI family thioesterase [Paracoccus tegillarcae]AUH32887.1 competence protein ComA [Paracoccus tegillarcae]